mmetsp:Transcript_22746/g.29448  ORF Transcript_22746/g.29448 Transcript_22746/m.29448 type:complete len:307 (+) Transcript_22746:32-952(+)|eukprot:CAMPEP_0197319404 /NCGR_PEP_ID=MMETSP0891-20130614/54701_1 /TAXON_ID=44058 ORGANISM="Aureoumbra lagunensis, Strain CCMP1510" /NCGR_SAMPLE_ID=MMETSP0891 /ASSEMBLY_ACC=CAM_ASM_000534 /LENGTH=306 /DNA_ID=CAMNT_0042810319 /DNA_START=44 /DNA_END=964 /DNA_ORIENTATION=+
MGRKKKRLNNGEPELPLVPIKKIRRNAETPLSAVLALQIYAGIFKLGQPSYREKSTSPYTITIVMNGSELGTGQHGAKDAAIEKAALITLHLLDPEAKSIAANVQHHDEAELKALTLQIINARQDEIKSIVTRPSTIGPTTFQPVAPVVQPTFQIPQTFPTINTLPRPQLQLPPPRPMHGSPRISFPGMIQVPMPYPRPPPVGSMTMPTYPPTAQPRPQFPLNVPSTITVPPPLAAPSSAPGMVWIDEERSPEEVRAEMPRYEQSQQHLVKEAFDEDDHDEQDDDDFIERALAEHEATEARLAANS